MLKRRSLLGDISCNVYLIFLRLMNAKLREIQSIASALELTDSNPANKKVLQTASAELEQLMAQLREMALHPLESKAVDQACLQARDLVHKVISCTPAATQLYMSIPVLKSALDSVTPNFTNIS